MSKRKKERPEAQYADRLPEKVLEELTPEVRMQYFLWDEIMKKEIQLYPHLMLPLVKEIFNKEYPDDRNITLLSTEYTVSRVYKAGKKLLGSIRSDILMKIAGDLYHFECQMKKDGKMVFRMFEYDVNIALTHGKTVLTEKGLQEEGRQEKFMLSFPKSAVLYLGNEKSVREYEACEICFPDGTRHLYRVPVMRVQEYGLGEIEEKHLALLLPFLPIRFRERIRKAVGKDKEDTAPDIKAEREEKRAAERKGIKDDMTKFLSECLAVLDREEENGTVTEIMRKDIAEFLWKACGYLLEGDEELLMLVRVELEPVIKLSREIIDELQESNKGLQGDIKKLQDSNRELRDSNRELQNSNKELFQGMEDSYRRLIEKSRSRGKSVEETEDELMAVFALSRETAKEKMKYYNEES